MARGSPWSQRPSVDLSRSLSCSSEQLYQVLPQAVGDFFSLMVLPLCGFSGAEETHVGQGSQLCCACRAGTRACFCCQHWEEDVSWARVRCAYEWQGA